MIRVLATIRVWVIFGKSTSYGGGTFRSKSDADLTAIPFTAFTSISPVPPLWAAILWAAGVGIGCPFPLRPTTTPAAAAAAATSGADAADAGVEAGVGVRHRLFLSQA